MENEIAYNESILVEDAKQIVEKGRNAAYQSVNTAMISTYWKLGQRIVEEEQKG